MTDRAARLVTGCTLLMLASCHAPGDIDVDTFFPHGTFSQSEVLGQPGVYDVTLTPNPNTNGPTTFVLQAGEIGDAIRMLSIAERPGGGDSRVVISIRQYPVDGRTPLSYLQTIDIVNPTNTDFSITIMNVTGDVGKAGTSSTWELSHFGIAAIGGDWWADVHVEGLSTAVSRLRVEGDWLGGGFYRDHTIAEVEAGYPNGDGLIQGSTTDPIEIWSATDIENILAGNLVDVRIGETALYSGFSDVLSCDIGMHFVSSTSMTMNSLGTLRVLGAYNADIQVETAMDQTSVYDIGDSIGADARFRFPQNGLAGQIIVNSNDNFGAWTSGAEVRVATTGSDIVIDGPAYTDLSTSIGGGAVGLVPYDLHGPDCDPTDSALVPEASGGPILQTVRIRHYGPIAISGADLPVKVEKNLDWWPGWTDVSHDFTAAVDTLNTRDLIVTAKAGTDGFACPAKYRVTSLTGKLICAGSPALLASAVDVVPYTYNIHVRCKADISMNGVVDTPDPILWTQDPIDVNDDGLVDTNDLAAILEEME